MSVVLLLVRCFYAPDFQLMQVSNLAPTPVQEQVISFPWIMGTVFIVFSSSLIHEVMKLVVSFNHCLKEW
jgi:hypothetical protein